MTAHAGGQCATPEQQAEMSRFVERLSEAETTDEAQRQANRKLRRSRRAIRRARVLVPKDRELRAAEAKLDALAVEVGRASSPAEVGHAFTAASTPTAGGCVYSGGEIVAIVLGLILGVIPGVILLILLC